MLATTAQQDFSAGMVRSVARHLIPRSAAYDLVNLLLDDDGSAYRRGGSAFKNVNAFGAGGLRWLWEGRLLAGRRTVFANGADFGVLNPADETRAPINLGGAGLGAPVGSAVIAGVLHVAGGVIYAGSVQAADFSTGTVTATQGSAIVTLAGASWTGNVDVGMFLRVAGGPVYVVASVDSSTQVTLDRPFAEATVRAAAYTLRRLETAPLVSELYVAGGDRLIGCRGNRITFSKRRDDTTGALQWWSFDPLDYIELPAGVAIVGAAMLRDLLLVFSTAGMWSVENVHLDLLDDFGNPQRRLDLLSGDVVLWGQPGIASWQNALVVPTLEGAVLVDGVSVPTPIAKAIMPLAAGYVDAGLSLGLAAVFRNHYLLPVLDASGDPVDLLVCRLDRPVRTQLGTIFPWTRFAGHGADVTAFAVRVGDESEAREPSLFAAGLDGKLLDLTGFFAPSAALKADADGTVHEWALEGRDFATGNGNLNTVTRFRVRYELKDAAGDDPEIIARYSVGSVQPGVPSWGVSEWGGFDWTDDVLAEFVTFAERAPESTGRDPFVWLLAVGARYIRPRLESADPAAKLVIRSVEWTIRQNARDR